MTGAVSKTTATIRTFLALQLPASVRDTLSSLESEFDPVRAALRWVAPELLHLTVRFLGDVPAGRMDAVAAAARSAALATVPFTLTVEQVGSFSGSRGTRVIWAGLRRDLGYGLLTGLFLRVEDALEEEGFAGEQRAFSPHVTLARVRDDAPSNLRREVVARVDALERSCRLELSVPVTELVVMRSDLSSSGPRYTPLHRFALQGVPVR